MRKLAILAMVISTSFAAAQSIPAPPPDPFQPERRLVAGRQYEEAIKRLEERAKNGDCRSAVCDANLALALSKLQQTDRALDHAQKAIDRIAEEPLMSAWEANEIGILLFRAPKRGKDRLGAAAKAFRFARVHYRGRGSNIVFNLKETLQALGEQSEASALQRELDSRFVIDPRMGILGDFQGVTIERR